MGGVRWNGDVSKSGKEAAFQAFLISFFGKLITCLPPFTGITLKIFIFLRNTPSPCQFPAPLEGLETINTVPRGGVGCYTV